MEDWELLAYAITFAKLDNGNRDWDWGTMSFVER